MGRRHARDQPAEVPPDPEIIAPRKDANFEKKEFTTKIPVRQGPNQRRYGYFIRSRRTRRYEMIMSESLVTFVLLCFEIFAACADDLRSADNRNRIFFPPRRKGAKVMGKSEKRWQNISTLNLQTLRPLRSFGVAQDMFCGKHSELWLRLPRAQSFMVDTLPH